MKKTTFSFKKSINFKNIIYLLCLLFPMLLQCCNVDRYDMTGSLDGNIQRFSGNSFDFPDDDRMQPGQNIGFDVVMGVFRHSGSSTFNNTNPGNSGNLYASTDHWPAAFYNSNGNNPENSLDTKPSDFINNLRFMGGLEFISKRSSDDGTTMTLNYLQVPLYALYNAQLSSGGSIFGGLGPYFAYGIGGNTESTFNGKTFESKSFDKTSGYNPFDAGVGLTAGYKMPGSFSFRFGYDFGIANIDRSPFDKTKNIGISLTVGYPLDRLIKMTKSK